MTRPVRLVTIGETMALVTPSRAESLVTAQDFWVVSGGAESNVAAHAADLGISTAWVSALGADALGARVRADIAGRGVDVRWVRHDPDARTGVYVKDPGQGVSYYRDNSAASRMGPETVAGVPLEGAEVVHISGVTPALSPSCAELIDAVIDRVAGHGLVSFDVNHRAALWRPGVAAPTLLDLARRADLVFVGLDEAQGLWDTVDADAVRALIPEPQLLVVKDGDVGATEFDRREPADVRTFVPAIPTEVVEAVGAGDAFAAGYLAALLQGASAEQRLTGGHRRARLALQSTSEITHTPQPSGAAS